jgi:GNAT superfamily N-acetyltransferase
MISPVDVEDQCALVIGCPVPAEPLRPHAECGTATETLLRVPVELVEVDWSDERAVELRAEMDTWLSLRYRDAPPLSPAARIALSVDGEDIVATVLAVVDGIAVGHGALRRLGEDLEVKRVVVTESGRGRGLSYALMAGLERRARELGATRLILSTGDRQREAVHVYEKIGYVETDLYPPYDVVPWTRCFAKEI